MSKSDTIAVGKITGPHGIRGEVKVYVYGDAGFPYEEVYIEGRPTPLVVIKARPHKGGYIVEFKGLGDRGEAERLTGTELFVPSDVLPGLEPDEYYHADLIGMEVLAIGLGPDGEMSGYEDEGAADVATSLGTVREVISTGSNDVLEVYGPLGEVLVPVIEEVVVEMDIAGGVITVRLPEGLLEARPSSVPDDGTEGKGRARSKARDKDRGRGGAGTK